MGTFIIGGIILAVFLIVAFFSYRRYKSGCGCGGGNCKDCALTQSDKKAE